MIKHTPWFPGIRVFEVRRFEHELLKVQVPDYTRRSKICTEDLDRAAYKANVEIIKLLMSI